MKKSFFKIFIRTIRSTLSRFLAILAIVALGVGFLAGLLVSPEDMRLSADRYYDESRLYDIRVVSTLGLTEEDLRQVREVPGIEAVMPAYDTDLILLSSAGDSYTTRLHSLPEGATAVGEEEIDGAETLNRLVLTDGRMPEKSGECVLLVSQTFSIPLAEIGDTLTPAPENEELNDKLPKELTVVGTVKSSAYISIETEHTTVGTGTVQAVVFTPDSSFDMEYYTGFYLSVDGAETLNSFGTPYEETVQSVTDVLDPLGEDRAKIRYEELVSDAQEKLQEGKDEYNEKKAEADKEFADAKKKLEDAAQEIADNELKLSDALTQIQNGWAELETNRETYNTQIPAAQLQIANGYAQLETYQQQLNDGLSQIYTAQAQIDEGYVQLDAGDAQLAAAKAQLDAQEPGIAALESGKAALWGIAAQFGITYADTSDASALSVIASLQAVLEGDIPLPPDQKEAIKQQLSQLQAGLSALSAQGTTTEAARAALTAGRAQYEEKHAQAVAARTDLDSKQALLNGQAAPLYTKQQELSSAKAELDGQNAALQETIDNSLYQFSLAETELANAQVQYDDGKAKLEEGKKELADGQKEYDDNKKEADQKLADAWEEIADAEAKVRDITEGEWYVLSRSDANPSFVSYNDNADKIASIAQVFPVFFFLVAALVALTTMTRMVEEERQQIGTLKALGYSRKKIALKYLLYAAAACVAGSILGLVVGMQLFPTIIINAYNIIYDMPAPVTPFHVSYAMASALVAVVCTLLATLNACWSELREVPSALMLPKAPKAGKRIFLEYITPLWSRLKFTQKVTARNLLRYKKRFFMTVIGISGCTALLLTGFGVRDSVSDIVPLQFDELSHYQLTVGLKDVSALEGRDLKTVLGDKTQIESFLPVLQNNGIVVPEQDNPDDNVVLFVPEDMSTLADYFTFRHRTDHSPIELTEDSVIISEKLSERQHIKVGDSITVQNQDEKEATLTVTDICENYVRNYLYFSKTAYAKAFGEEAESNSILCKLPEGFTAEQEPALSAALLKCRDISGASFTTELSESFGKSLNSLNTIVYVLIVAAGALAFVVLYNLTNINITERCKEIATIKVLGFYDKEVSAYIYRETAALTLIGAALGLALGVALHAFVIRTAEVDMAMFGRSIYWLSYVWSFLLTVFFSLLVNLVMHRKLKKISMVESMKAPE